ncbi:MAG: hypothetical protein WAM71_06200 [Candidatus Korobacteraceae bacterium]
MWADVERDMADILSSRLFPTLSTDPGYRVMLRNAGLTSIPDGKDNKVNPAFDQAQKAWRNSIPMQSPLKLHSSIQNLPQDTKLKLKTAAQMCSQLLLREVEAQNSLRERRAKAVVLEGSLNLYRVWDSTMDNRTRHWWFSEHLLNYAVRESKATGQSTHDWLRDRLAVSLNFGKCDRLSNLVLGPAAALPAIEAWGLPMPQRSSITRDARGNTVGELTPDYWQKIAASFQGEKTQYFLPFIPPDRIKDQPWP